MSSIYSIYKVTNTINGKVYIGFDSNWPRRKNVHKHNYNKLNYRFYKAIRKYGWNNFEWSLLFQSKDKDYTLKTMEPYFIIEYNSYKNGYNSTLGGEGIFGFSRKQSKEEKEKRRLLMLGNKYAKGKGKPFDEERKKKLRKPRINIVKSLSQKHKDNISKSNSGKEKQKIMCPHCKKIGGIPQMKQWHFNNCKFYSETLYSSSIS